jgi:hypothetical protein
MTGAASAPDETALALPRGIRNHNPGNIDYAPSNDPWEGLDNPPSDGRFCRFTSAAYGLRAIVKLLINYQRYDHCRTIRQIINRWAPRSENDTQGYAAFVASEVGLQSHEPVSVADADVMRALVKAIVRQECGLNHGDPWFGDATITEAMALAGFHIPNLKAGN